MIDHITDDSLLLGIMFTVAATTSVQVRLVENAARQIENGLCVVLNFAIVTFNLWKSAVIPMSGRC